MAPLECMILPLQWGTWLSPCDLGMIRFILRLLADFAAACSKPKLDSSFNWLVVSTILNEYVSESSNHPKVVGNVNQNQTTNQMQPVNLCPGNILAQTIGPLVEPH